LGVPHPLLFPLRFRPPGFPLPLPRGQVLPEHSALLRRPLAVAGGLQEGGQGLPGQGVGDPAREQPGHQPDHTIRLVRMP
ncbi:hypothetical protein HGM15179_020524, partial [Zosterops borbonicus]